MPDFKELSLSKETQRGLKDSGFTTPTEIQIQTLELALKGKDVLGAAKTGSGKTLAFLIPVLERLHAVTWNPMDGLGALIITPTRELAYQIFEVMRKVGRYHSFSGGLVIGGKDLKHERNRLDTCNIIVCTPGRILQHMDENPNFHWDQLQILVLDEADKILDMGFSKTMNAIIENLPPKRQTLLFSATQTKRVQDLARLSLKKPKYVSAHELSATVTPDTLQQSYLICPLHQKLDMLWSFLKTHRNQKIMVFMASCKQVKYAYELFTKLHPPGHLLSLYGSLHQLRRMKIYDEFCRKQNAVLFSTDIAARGLDFPAVAWVVQLDCPEDVNTYIHRVGRTARSEQDGHSLLILLPSEEKAMLKMLHEKEIPITPLHLNEYHQTSIQRKAEALCARDLELKASAQRAFKSYFKSVHLMKHKEVFSVKNLDKDRFAQSLGLVVTPRVRFLEKSSSVSSKRIVFKDDSVSKVSPSAVSTEPTHSKQINLLNSGSSGDEEDSEELFTKKSAWKPDDSEETDLPEPPPAPIRKKKKDMITKASVVKKLAKKKIISNKKIVFDEDGEPIIDTPTQQTSEKLKQLDERHVSGIDIELAKEIMKDEDKVDKQIHKKVIQEKKLKRKLKEKEASRRDMFADKRAVLLAGAEEDESENENMDEVTNRYIDELPDPDRLGPDSDVYESEASGGESTEEQEKPSKKKQRKQRQLASSSSSDEEEDAEANDWQLPDQESLALHLLSK